MICTTEFCLSLNNMSLLVKEMKRERPNIFSYATSELSQDAMFCWLIEWAGKKYEDVDGDLYNIGQNFVKLLINNQDCIIDKVHVIKQKQNIDIVVEINNNIVLVIEDKTETSVRHNQLEKYREEIKDKYKGNGMDLRYVYVKTGNEPLSILNDVKTKGYNIILRKDILKCIEKYNGDCQLLLDYIAHLCIIEEKTNQFSQIPFNEWKNEWYSWQGFYMELGKSLINSDWKYVPNPSGGFLCLHWYHHYIDKSVNEDKMYLLFEESKLCFKISCVDKDRQSNVRNVQSNKILKLAKDKGYNEIIKPNFGKGKDMTIAIVKSDIIGENGIINIGDILNKLKKYEKLVDDCCME